MLHGDLLLQELRVLDFHLLQLGQCQVFVSVNARNFTLLLVKDALKLRFQFPFDLLIVFYELASKRFLFFFEVFDSFIQNLDVKLELLLYLDMVSHLTLIVL